MPALRQSSLPSASQVAILSPSDGHMTVLSYSEPVRGRRRRWRSQVLVKATTGVSLGSLGTFWRLCALFAGILPHKPSARVAYTAQVSAASVGHLPHLLPYSPPIAEIAGRAVKIFTPTRE